MGGGGFFQKGPFCEIIESFRFDYEDEYEYKIRQAKRMLYAYAIPNRREKVVAVAHRLSTKWWRNLVVLTTTFKKTKKVGFFCFPKKICSK